MGNIVDGIGNLFILMLITIAVMGLMLIPGKSSHKGTKYKIYEVEEKKYACPEGTKAIKLTEGVMCVAKVITVPEGK
jgi:hypothetical protein